MTKNAKHEPDVTVELRNSGCPIDGRIDKHTHSQREWRKVIDNTEPWKRKRT